jgi:hypothetical protein
VAPLQIFKNRYLDLYIRNGYAVPTDPLFIKLHSNLDVLRMNKNTLILERKLWEK